MAGDHRPSNVKDQKNLKGFTQATGTEEPPEYLKPLAKELWQSSIKELFDAGHLQKPDLEILAMYCQAYAQYVDLQEIINDPDFEPVYTANSGYPCPNPAIKMANDQLTIVKNLGMKLNFNPDARIKSKIGSMGAKEEQRDPVLKALKNNRKTG